MKVIKQNVLNLIGGKCTVCITTNGVVKSNGEAVMGAGVAKAFAIRYPQIPKNLGCNIKLAGNGTTSLGVFDGTDVVAFPTKNNWRDCSELSLIKKSAQQLRTLIGTNAVYVPVYLPKPGCRLGSLKWKDVEPILDEVFQGDERIIICEL